MLTDRKASNSLFCQVLLEDGSIQNPWPRQLHDGCVAQKAADSEMDFCDRLSAMTSFPAKCAKSALIFAVLCASARDIPAQEASSVTANGVAIDAVLDEIQKGLVDAQSRIANLHVPPLSSVALTLQTQYDAKGGPKFKLFVISFGATWERQTSNELDITLKPPPPHAAVQMGKTQGLSEQLVNAIVAVAEGVKNAPSRQPPITLDNLKVEIQFVITTDVSGGGQFAILPVSAELSGDLSKKAVHKVSVVFSNPVPKTKS